MIGKKLITKKLLVWSVLGAILSASMIIGCAGDTGRGDARDSDRSTVSRGISGHGGGESGDEHSSRRGGNESSEEHRRGIGEHASGGDGSSTVPGERRETGEAAMSSPITPLGQAWNGVLGGLAVSMKYDAATQSVHGTVRNTLSQILCYVQAEPHLKSGTKTVGELGPDKLGHLNPGQEVTSSLPVASETTLAEVSYDGYVVHMEVFDCNGTGPGAHIGEEGTEGNSEHGSGGEEGRGANALALDETLDTIRRGARLVLKYDAPSNSFKGTVENTSNGVLSRVRIEVHLSNGTELGPTTPADVAPGEAIAINLPSTSASFTGWTAHAEFGAGGEGSELGGEHRADVEHGGSTIAPHREYGSGGESGSEHGSGGERRGGE